MPQMDSMGRLISKQTNKNLNAHEINTVSVIKVIYHTILCSKLDIKQGCALTWLGNKHTTPAQADSCV